jgi:hypothetical protein
MLSKASGYILVLSVVTITAFANAQTSRPARMFNSKLKLKVYAEEIERDGSKRRKWLGTTPSAKPIAIPHGVKWWVSPSDTAIEDVGLRLVYQYIVDHDIPGLSLSSCENITDAGLAHLNGLAKLEDIKLWLNDKITDADLAHRKGLAKLERLNLYGCYNISDAGFAHLKGLTKLEWLNLYGCHNITDAGLAHMKGLTKLEQLDIRHCCKITDAGLAHLKGLTKLERLEIRDCAKITDAGLIHLKGLAKLEELDLYGCNKITKAGIAELEKALPNTAIRHQLDL